MKILLTLAALFLSALCFAQSPKVAYSEAFDEPKSHSIKLFQCNNGNTLLINYTFLGRKSGIGVDVYNPAHKLIAQSDLESALLSAKDLSYARTVTLVNTGNDVALFLEVPDGKQPVLYRMILSPETGKLIKEDKIAEMPAYKMGSRFAMSYGDVHPKKFFVEADQETGSYAIISFDGFAEETAKRIELVHYSADHRELSRSFYDAPATQFKYINYLGMVVDGNNKVYLCTYAYNTNSSGGKESTIILSSLAPGGEMTHQPLNVKININGANTILVYNKPAKLLEVLLLANIDSKTPFLSNKTTNYYSVALIGVHTESGEVAFAKTLNTTKMTDYRRSHFKMNEPYSGLPINIVANQDGSTTVLMEEKEERAVGKSIETWLGDVGILELNDKGEETAGYVIRKMQGSPFGSNLFAQHFIHRNNVLGGNYSSFDYLTSGTNRFILFNNMPEDPDSKKPAWGYSESNTFYYQLTGGELNRAYLFGKPGETFANRFVLITSGNYSETTGDYAVLVLEEVDRRHKMAHVAWVHLKS